MHSECVILIAFPLQQWWHERALVLLCTYVARLVKGPEYTSIISPPLPTVTLATFDHEASTLASLRFQRWPTLRYSIKFLEFSSYFWPLSLLIKCKVSGKVCVCVCV